MNRPLPESRWCRPLSWLALFFVVLPGLAGAQQLIGPQRLDWLHRFGAAGYYDDAAAVATDASGVYVTGRTKAPLPGTTGTDLDAFVRKYDFAGKVLWVRQFKVGTVDEPFAIAVDGQGIYVAGRSEGTLFGAFVSRLDLAGNVVWSHVFDALKMTEAWSIAAHPTGLYVAGDVRGTAGGPALAKLDFGGNEVWTLPPAGGAGSDGIYMGVAVDDTGVYGIGAIGAADVRKFDFDGREVAQFGDGHFKGASTGEVIALDETGIYVVGRRSDDFFDYRMRKYSRSGELLWEKALELPAAALAVDASGIYVMCSNSYGQQPYVAKYTLDGDFLWHGAFGEQLDVYSGAVHEGAVYLAGAAFGPTEDDTNSFVARFSATRPPQLLSLGMIDGAPALAVLVHDPSLPKVAARVRNAVSGARIGYVVFSSTVHPQELLALPDRNGNGTPELALLGIDETTGAVVAEIRDSQGGALLGTVPFDKSFMPRRLVVVPAPDAAGPPGLALLGASATDRSLQAEIRDSVTGAHLGAIGFNRWHVNEPFADLRAAPDANGNGSAELAALIIANPLAGSRAEIKDAGTAQTLGSIWFERDYCPRDLVVAPDLVSHGGPGLATLLQGCFERLDGVRADVHGVLAGEASASIGYRKFMRPVSLIVLPDSDGNGSPEFGVMALDTGTDRDVLSIKDIAANLWLRSIAFNRAGYRHRGVTLLPDVNGNGTSDVAQLQERRGGRQLRILIKDTVTGAFIRYVY